MAKGVPETHPEERDALNISPKKNWVEKAGGLPSYINSVAVALVRGGMPRERAIPTAVNVVKKTCATGLWGGRPNAKVSPAIRAAACKAAASWEAKKGGAKLSACADCGAVDLASGTVTPASIAANAITGAKISGNTVDLAGPVVTSKAGGSYTTNALLKPPAGLKPRHMRALAKANANLAKAGMPKGKRRRVIASMAKRLRSGKVNLSVPLAGSRTVDLAFNPDEVRGWHGRWSKGLDSRAADAHLRETQGGTRLSGEASKAVRAYVTGSADGTAGKRWTQRTVSRRLRAATPKLTKSQAAEVQGLDQAFAELPPTERPLKLYRGVPHNWNGSHKLKAVPGEALADPGYISTTTSPKVARDFAGRYGDVEQITLPAGSKALHVNSHVKGAYGGEHEVLLPRGTVVHVAGVEKRLTPTVGPHGREIAEGRTVMAEVAGHAPAKLAAA